MDEWWIASHSKKKYFFLEWDAIHHSSISGACDLDQSEAYTIYRNLYKNAAL